ncbi:MAG: GatB/YqeY domain-containing protein [Ignavibacteria bacterium]|nr:GatB/YqeY domain-containing protein [Ignavibacteria bacterium]
MSLKETIIKDLTSAMKQGERIRLATLRTVKAALMEKEISMRGTGKDLTEADELAVMMGLAKKRKESIELFLKGNRPELAEIEGQELKIIESYLPAMMSEVEIGEVVKRVILETGAAGSADFGRVMPAVMKEVKGKADGRVVQTVVRQLLEGVD